MRNSFDTEAEYHDALLCFDRNYGEEKYEDHKDRIKEIILSIFTSTPMSIPIMKVNYLMMSSLNMNKYEAQKMIRYAMSSGLLALGDGSDLTNDPDITKHNDMYS